MIPMIHLHQYPAVWGLSSLSPFCIKVEAFLRMAGLPYKIIVEKNPARGPKGKMPFVFIEEENLVLADSSFIIEHLLKRSECGHLKIRDPLLNSQALAFQRLIEEGLYFSVLYGRWVDREGWAIVKPHFKKLFPPFVGTLALGLIRFNLQKQALAQGIGRHSPEEVYHLAGQDISALSTYLGNRPYFMGESLSYLDATVFAFLLTILKFPGESPLKQKVTFHGNLRQYTENMERTLFPPP